MFLEEGLSFYADRITACGVTHHGTGMPLLAPYAGGRIPHAEIQARRQKIISENQGQGHESCRGCPFLADSLWEDRPEPRIRWLGLTHFNGCNLACNYCWLQWAGNSPRNSPDKRTAFYEVTPIVEELARDGHLASDLVVDWGGGGEPTTMPEFSRVFPLLAAHGATQWLHTNAVKLPAVILDRGYEGGRLNVLCSVDAGTAATYRAIKGRDALDDVWRHLALYRERGAKVIVKFIVTPENRARAEIEAFVGRALEARVHAIQPDIDLRFPDPPSEMIDALAFLWFHAARRRVPVQFGGTGTNSALEFGVEGRVRQRFERFCLDDLAAYMKERNERVPPWSHPALHVRGLRGARLRRLLRKLHRAMSLELAARLTRWAGRGFQ